MKMLTLVSMPTGGFLLARPVAPSRNLAPLIREHETRVYLDGITCSIFHTRISSSRA